MFPRKPQPGEPLKREREEEDVEPTDGNVQDTGDENNKAVAEPPKKKRRVALTRVGDLGS